MQERLLDIGQWLRVNGEAIYGTRKNAITLEKSGHCNIYFTKKEKVTYAIITNWPGNTLEFTIDAKKRIKAVSMVGYKGDIRWSTRGDKLIMSVPQLTVNLLPCMYAWSFRVEYE
jgi:alpha-L-fucosidase